MALVSKCCYNAVQHNTILHTAQKWLKQNIYQSYHPQGTPRSSPVRASYCVYCEDLRENWPRYNGTALYVLFIDTFSPSAVKLHGIIDLGHHGIRWLLVWRMACVNSSPPGQNGRRSADDTFKRIFLNENVRISIEISLKFVPKRSINNIPALVQIMAWRRIGDKPLSKPMPTRCTDTYMRH